MPASRSEFWHLKLETNVKRDAQVRQKLVEQGWRGHGIWECETKDEKQLLQHVCEVVDINSKETGKCQLDQN